MAGPLILLADSQVASRAVLRSILELAGYRVIEAETGREAIRLARRKLPGVILMEASLPIIDGFEAARLLKSDPRTAKIPVVALTLSAAPSECEAAERAGCDGYLVKPCSPQTLLAEVDYHNRVVPRERTPAGSEAGVDGHSRRDCTPPPGMRRDWTDPKIRTDSKAKRSPAANESVNC